MYRVIQGCRVENKIVPTWITEVDPDHCIDRLEDIVNGQLSVIIQKPTGRVPAM